MHGELAILDQTRLDVVRASQDSEQAGIGWCLIIGILDQHSHFAADALQAHRHRRSTWGFGSETTAFHPKKS
jgi:hypothetical protein